MHYPLTRRNWLPTDNLQDAIELGRRTVAATLEDHLDLSQRSDNLGTRLQDRFRRIGAIQDLEEAIEFGRLAVVMTPECHPDLSQRLNSLGAHRSQGCFKSTCFKMRRMEECQSNPRWRSTRRKCHSSRHPSDLRCFGPGNRTAG